ncbi:MAG: HPF/RaiA family ribosome-associated protein [Bryobacterales bacterium]|jgi:hypothetical protein|nr:HPF/RaiA family ribosome-associated protein [Bryobacterales bacterium]
MRIQVNSDKTVDVNDGLKLAVKTHMKKSFDRYGDRVTRVEVHLSDLNGNRGGDMDKRCLLEVRPAGMDPLAVTHQAATVDDAWKGATRKMVRKLTTRFAKATKPVADPAVARA